MTPDELKKIRKSMKLTQAEMAKELSTPFRSYQNWEEGSRRIPGIVQVAIECIQRKTRKKK